MKVNGTPVAATSSVLAACRAVGADVPAFCADERLSTGGHCRACLVEIDGRLVASCTTPARPGLEVETDTPRLRAYRLDLGELMLAESTTGALAATLATWGCDGTRYERSRAATPRHDTSHPYLALDLGACIKCRKCVKGCEELQGQFVFAFAARGAATTLTWGPDAFAASACVACGACASLCPTGAITDVDRLRRAPTTRVVQSTCSYCGVGCSLDVHVAGAAPLDRVQRIEGTRESPVNHGHLCVKGRYAHGFSRHPDRLTTPLIRRDGVLEPATWDEALALVGSTFLRLRGHVAALSSSRCTNEENYLVQKWMRVALGTNNVDCCARVCHGPTAAGMRHVLGTGAATNSLADIERADLLLVAGSNSTAAHPVTGARIKQAVLRGARLIVIDPRRTELAELADVHLQLRIGTNVVLLNSLARAMLDDGAIDRAFIDARTEGFVAYAAFLDAYAPEATEAITGVPAELVRRAAHLYGTAQRPMQTHGLGMTEHYQGSEGVMLLCNLALLAGAIGRDGVGVNPLRGQNNVQGAADMGCQPDLVTGYGSVTDPVVRARFERVWGAALPTDHGLTIPRMYDAARAGEVRALYILGEDVVQTDPAVHTDSALAALEFLVVQELFLSETARRAHVVLPGASFLEKDGTFTNGERRIQRVRQAISPPGQARADWRVLCDLMAATGAPQTFTDPSEIMAEIAQVAPGFAGVSYPRLEPFGLQWPVPSEDHPGTSTLHVDSFPVGRATFACVAYAPSPVLAHADGFPLRLTTGRVLEHYNCGTMTRRGDNVVLHPADELEVHAVDARAAGLVDGAPVRVISPFGEAHAIVRLSDRMTPGQAFLSFHFPETGTNRLISGVLDRIADCPEYKITPVRIERIERTT
ncbi:MAG: formate dehydrogenase subunit alpha [Proteobacteria bacterium]|nr:formate dehydrogenase subunit alpha [Pseudomonadota bacterium]